MAGLRGAPCPKCGSRSTWIEQDSGYIVQRCLCGLARHVLHYSQDTGLTLVDPRPLVVEVKLPKPDTKSHQCLMALIEWYPNPATTTTVADICGRGPKQVSAMLAFLLSTGMVERVERRKGQPGGSLWSLSEEIIDYLQMPERLSWEKYDGTGDWGP